MPDPKDEQTIMQRFDRLLKAMVQGAPSGKTPVEVLVRRIVEVTVRNGALRRPRRTTIRSDEPESEMRP
jgi:hypothetical protein